MNRFSLPSPSRDRASISGAKCAAGKTALSVYILQTILCIWVLYPPQGLALYGQQGWAAMMATALAISVFLLWLANWYDRRYTIAPVEWAWRSMVEGRWLPFGRRVPAVPLGSPLPL